MFPSIKKSIMWKQMLKNNLARFRLYLKIFFYDDAHFLWSKFCVDIIAS